MSTIRHITLPSGDIIDPQHVSYVRFESSNNTTNVAMFTGSSIRMLICQGDCREEIGKLLKEPTIGDIRAKIDAEKKCDPKILAKPLDDTSGAFIQVLGILYQHPEMTRRLLRHELLNLNVAIETAAPNAKRFDVVDGVVNETGR